MRRIITILMMLPLFVFSQNSMNLVLMGTYEWNNTEGAAVIAALLHLDEAACTPI